jgi:hypothetical protein
MTSEELYSTSNGVARSACHFPLSPELKKYMQVLRTNEAGRNTHIGAIFESTPVRQTLRCFKASLSTGNRNVGPGLRVPL